MLRTLESRLAALVGDAVTARTHLSVVSFGPAPEADEAAVQVALDALSVEPAFARESLAFGGGSGPPVSRRVLPLAFTSVLRFAGRPADGDDSALQSARARLLDDVSVVAHALAREPVRSGRAFASGPPDPGLNVRAFNLTTGGLAAAVEDGLVRSELRYDGLAEIWPPGVTTPEGEIAAIDMLSALQPLALRADDAVLARGATTSIRIGGPAGQRLVDPETGARVAPRLALAVLSDLPVDRRGTVTSGVAGLETGVRVVEVTEPETVVSYRAPTGTGAELTEYVAVHIARPDGARGAFLGSAPVAVAAG